MGSGKKTTRTRQTYTPPSWIESAAQQATGLATQYARQPYRPYTGDRVAQLTPEQERARGLAMESSGAYQGDLDSARGALEGVQQFGDADIDQYMSPYIASALDPAARELREEGMRRRNQRLGQMDVAGAYGSRAALALREEDEMTNQGLSDLYATGYQSAFDRATDLWQADQDRQIQVGQEFMNLAGMGSDLVDKDIARLMQTGEAARQIEQQMKDFDYQQFIEQRDWGGRQAAYLTDVLRGLKGSYTETQAGKTTTKSKGNVLGQVLGAAVTIGAAYFTGGASLAAGVSDRRLKSNVIEIGYLSHNNLPVYEYDIGGSRQTGVMADEVLQVMPEAVGVTEDGYLFVHYDRIGWDITRVVHVIEEAA